MSKGKEPEGEVPYAWSETVRVTLGEAMLEKERVGEEFASGDQWAGTWADDGHLYMGWGDGRGFGGHRGGWTDPNTAFMGLARIEGTPPDHQGTNVWGGFEPESREGALYAHAEPEALNLKPADGLVSIAGVMYWYAERKSDGRVDCELITSSDYGKTWTDHGRFFREDGRFAFTGVIQYGRNLGDLPADLGRYLYVFDGGTKNEEHPLFNRTDMLLARIPLDDPTNRDAVTFFSGTPETPAWTPAIEAATPVFEDANGVNAHVSCTYNRAIGRYFLTAMHTVEAVTEGLGIFESEKPWGPWRTVYYTNDLDEMVPGMTLLINASLPSKWISEDGKRMWMVFSGRPSDPMYSFNVIEVKVSAD